MAALLEIPAVRARVHRMSVAEYHRAGETGLLSADVELLRGIVVTKMPQSPLHELVLQKWMKRLLAQVPNGFDVRREEPLTLRDSEPEPALSVVRGVADDWATAHPSTAHLVVEVAVSSVPLDEGKARRKSTLKRAFWNIGSCARRTARWMYIANPPSKAICPGPPSPTPSIFVARAFRKSSSCSPQSGRPQALNPPSQ